MKTCKLTILDEVNVKFTGIEEPSIRKQMMDCVKEIDHRAKYTPAGRMGRWNGEVGFMTVGGNTYLHLLYVPCSDKKSKHFGKSMMDVLTESGYHVDVEDKRKVNIDIPFEPIDDQYLADITFPAGHPAEGQPIILREHQVKVINSLLANRHGIGLAATGSGKTLICAALARKVQQYGRTIVIVPSTDLVTQTEEDYQLCGLDVGVVYGGRKEFHHTHTICTWQSLNSLWKQYKRKPEGHVEWEEHDLEKLLDGVVNVIVDECQSSSADSLTNVLGKIMNDIPLRWGLTGTIPKDKISEKKININVGNVVVEVKASELQDKGILSKCHVDVIKLKSSLKFNSFPDETKWLTTDPKRIKFISKFTEQISKQGNTLILVDRVQTGKDLVNLLGGDATFVYGDTKKKDRKKAYGAANTGNNGITIATYGVAAVGINIPRIFNLILVEPGKSFVRVIQSIGRGLRRAKDKDFVQIYDFCSSTKFSQKHSTERKKFYKEANYSFNETIVDEHIWNQ